MNMLRVDTKVAPPPLENPAARSAPTPRARENKPAQSLPQGGPDSAVALPKSQDGSGDPDVDALRRAVENVGAELKSISAHTLEISFEEEDSRFVVQILDSESGEVLRQIPPENLLEANRQLSALRGLLFDDRS